MRGDLSAPSPSQHTCDGLSQKQSLAPKKTVALRCETKPVAPDNRDRNRVPKRDERVEASPQSQWSRFVLLNLSYADAYWDRAAGHAYNQEQYISLQKGIPHGAHAVFRGVEGRHD